jgi:hypothetical protein
MDGPGLRLLIMHNNEHCKVRLGVRIKNIFIYNSVVLALDSLGFGLK